MIEPLTIWHVVPMIIIGIIMLIIIKKYGEEPRKKNV